MIHSNVQGLALNPSISRAKWFVTFIDDCPCYMDFPHERKFEVFTLFVKLFHEIKTQF